MVEIALKFGDFKAMRLANFIPVGFIEEFFKILHFTTGLPWYYNTIHTYISFYTLSLHRFIKLIVVNNNGDSDCQNSFSKKNVKRRLLSK